jgi:hypothetical protein
LEEIRVPVQIWHGAQDATAGLAPAPEWLGSDWVLAAFAKRLRDAQLYYRRFAADGKKQPSPWEDVKN